MKKYKKVLAITLILLVILETVDIYKEPIIANAAIIQDTINTLEISQGVYQLGDNVQGILSADGTLTVSGSGDMYNYSYNYSEEKGDSPFCKNNTVKKLIVKDGVTSIGSSAFEYCYNLREVDIAGTVKRVGNNAFYWCNNITTVIFREGVEELSLEIFAFGRCRQLRKVKFSSNLKQIKCNAFYGCFELNQFILPEGLEYIGQGSFGGCLRIEEFYIPASVNEIEGNPFDVCSNVIGDEKYILKNINVSPNNKVYKSIDGVVYSKDGTKLVWYPEGRKDQQYQIPYGVNTIGEFSFLGNDYLKQVKMPDTISNINKYAFSGCFALENINLPEGLHSIKGGAFSSCWKLDNICIPKSVKLIGYCAFVNCKMLNNITILNPNVKIQRATINNGELSDYIFDLCPESMIVHTFKDSTIDIYMNEFTDNNRAYDLQPMEAVEAMNVNYRTEEKIRQYVNSHKTKIGDKVTYTENPVLENEYKAGSLSKETSESALNTINIIRYIAGLDGEVSLNNDYSKQAQAASLINALNGYIFHYPQKPNNMSDELYELGYTGSKNSNLAQGYSTLNQAIINGLMNDGDVQNINGVRHRRWILNPFMNFVGFGAVVKEDKFYAMYATDDNAASLQYGVAWPAQTMPIEYFGTDYPWSFSLGFKVSENATVKLTDNNSGKVWNFSKTSSDGKFYISNEEYGQIEQIGCIIFRPSDSLSYKSGDSYTVEISNLENPSVKNNLLYTVKFFSLDNNTTCISNIAIPHSGDWEIVKPATCMSGIERRICSVCGKEETRTIEPISSCIFGDWEMVRPATCMTGIDHRICSVCGKEETRTIEPISSCTFGDWEIISEPTNENLFGIKQRKCLVCGNSEFEFYNKTEEKYGDVNLDGEVNITDAVILKKHLASMNVSYDEKLADLNKDAVIDIRDAILLLKLLAGYKINL